MGSTLRRRRSRRISRRASDLAGPRHSTRVPVYLQNGRRPPSGGRRPASSLGSSEPPLASFSTVPPPEEQNNDVVLPDVADAIRLFRESEG